MSYKQYFFGGKLQKDANTMQNAFDANNLWQINSSQGLLWVLITRLKSCLMCRLHPVFKHNYEQGVQFAIIKQGPARFSLIFKALNDYAINYASLYELLKDCICIYSLRLES